MKTRITALLLASTILSAPLYAKYDVGYELGATKFNTGDLTKTRPNNNFKLGYTHDTGLGLDAVYSYVPKTNFGTVNNSSSHSTRAGKVLAKYIHSFNDNFSGSVRAGAGYEHVSNRIESSNNVETKVTKERLFPALSAGINYHATRQVAVGLNVHHDARSHYSFKDNMYMTVGVNYTLPEGNKMA